MKYLENVLLNHRLLAGVLAAWCLSGCAHAARDLKPPVKLAFDAGQPGATAEIPVRVTEDTRYAIGLRFHYAQDRSRWQATDELLGMRTNPATGHLSDPATPARFKVTVHAAGQLEPLLEKEVDRPLSYAIHGGRYVDVAQVRLAPGRYVVGFSLSDNDAGLSGVKTEFYVHRAYQGK